MEGKAMAITRFSNQWTPSFPSLFDNLFEGNLFDWNRTNFAGENSTLPAVNILENENEFVIQVAAPGMKKEDFKVKFDNGTLTISSEVEHKEEEKQQVLRREFNYRSFQRTFNVSEKVIDSSKIGAKYENGILYVTLPKREEVKPKPAKEIEIH